MHRVENSLSDFDPAPIDHAAFMNRKNVRKRDFVFEHTCTMQCQEMQIARGAVMIVIPVVDAYGRHGTTSIPKAQVMLKYHEGKILAHQFCQLKASSELSIAVASVKEDTVEIRSVADRNHTMLKQLTEAVPLAVVQEVDQSAEMNNLETIVRYHELQLGLTSWEAGSQNSRENLADRVRCLLEHVRESETNKRPRSLRLRKQLFKIIFWLAHPDKEDAQTANFSTEDIDLLTCKTERSTILAVRVLVSILFRLCGEVFDFAVSLHELAQASGNDFLCSCEMIFSAAVN
jgi:hypothetical protein